LYSLIPPQRTQRVGVRVVLQADVALEPEAIHLGEQEVEVDLAGARLVPPGVVRDLDVVDLGELLAQDLPQVSLGALRVVDIVLDIHVGPPHLGDDVHHLRHPIEDEARDVEGVDVLDDLVHADLAQRIRRELQVLHQGFDMHLFGIPGDHLPRQAVHPRDGQHLGVLHRRLDPCPELLDPVRVSPDPAVAAGPVPARQIEEDDLQAVLIQGLLHLVRRLLVWEQKLHRLEPRLRRGGEALDEGLVGEHQRQVGSDLRHRPLPPWCPEQAEPALRDTLGQRTANIPRHTRPARGPRRTAFSPPE
jgi:hypothetical protein